MSDPNEKPNDPDSPEAGSSFTLNSTTDYMETRFTSAVPENVYAEAAAANTAKTGKTKRDSMQICVVVGLLVSGTILVLIFGCFVAVFLEIANLKASRELAQTNGLVSNLQDGASIQDSRVEQINESLYMNLDKIMNFHDHKFLQINKSLSNSEEALYSKLEKVAMHQESQINESIQERMDQIEGLSQNLEETANLLKFRINISLEEVRESYEGFQESLSQNLEVTSKLLNSRINTSLEEVSNLRGFQERIEESLSQNLEVIASLLNSRINSSLEEVSNLRESYESFQERIEESLSQNLKETAKLLNIQSNRSLEEVSRLHGTFERFQERMEKSLFEATADIDRKLLLVNRSLLEAANIQERKLQQVNQSLSRELTETASFHESILLQVNRSLLEETANLQDSIDQITEMNLEEVADLQDTIQGINESLSRDLKETTRFQDDKIQLLNVSIELIAEQLLQQSSVSRQINASVVAGFKQVDENEDLQESELLKLNMSVANINIVVLAGQFPFNPVTSCAALLPSSPSGYYWVVASNGSAVRVYCDMTRLCGGVTGGWMRVAELDMTNSSHQCPSGFRQRDNSDKRTCVRNSETRGCSSSVTISTATVRYSRVCGRIIAYQYGSPDAFARYEYHGPVTIDSPYVDGIVVTYGSPRKHLWTFVGVLDEVGSNSPRANCPCSDTNTASSSAWIPAFVGNDYFCDTASSGRYQLDFFYADDPLWDGAGCFPRSTCCSFNNPPWFSKQLSQPTTDDIEMRVCRDGPNAIDEDIAIELMDIYVQ